MRAHAYVLPLIASVFAVRFFPSLFTPPATATTNFGVAGIATDTIVESTVAAGVIIEGIGHEDERFDFTLATIATGDGGLNLKDDLVSAFVFAEGGTTYTQWRTGNSNERVEMHKRLTTTEGIASGTHRIVGGIAFSSAAGATAVTGATETATVWDLSYTLPANSMAVGTQLSIKTSGLCTLTTGAETHTMAPTFGGVSLGSSGNIDAADNDAWQVSTDCVVRAIGASGTIVCGGAMMNGARGGSTTVRQIYTGSAGTSTATIDTTAAAVVGSSITHQAVRTDTDSCRLDTIYVHITG